MTEPRDPGLGELLGASRRIVAQSLFHYLIELEVAKAQRLQYCFSVVCLRPDLAHAADRDRLSTPHVLHAIERCLRTTDVVTPLTDAAFAVLLIDAETTALPDIIGRLWNEVAAVALTGGERATWSAGAACYPKTADARNVVQKALDLLAFARGDGGDRFYVAS